MCVKQGYTPVLLMIEDSKQHEGKAARDWMENSRFSTADADNVFAAFEEMHDFTTEERPDVILLDVESCQADLPMIRGTVESIAAGTPFEILAINNSSEPSVERGAFEGNLEAVVAHLNELLPGETAY
jgi:hypothetical protein